MKKSIVIILLVGCIVLSIILPGCNRVGSSMNGSGKITDQEIKVADFTRIMARGDLILEINQTEAFQVILSTDNNLSSRILFSRDEETLKISIQAPANFFPTSLKIKVGMPRIYGLNLSAGAQAFVSGFKSTFNFDLEVSGNGILNGLLEAGNCVFLISETSQIKLTGSALSLDLDVSGASKLDLADFVVNNAQVNLQENSEADLNINGRIDIKLEGASKMYYLGNPKFSNTSISGDSFMQHK